MPVRRSASFLSCSGVGRGRSADESNTIKSLPAPCIFVKSMRISPRIAESSQRGTVPEHTSIHHGEYTCARRLLSSVLIDYTILQPECWHSQADAIIDDCRNMFRPAEDIDYINALA